MQENSCESNSLENKNSSNESSFCGSESANCHSVPIRRRRTCYSPFSLRRIRKPGHLLLGSVLILLCLPLLSESIGVYMDEKTWEAEDDFTGSSESEARTRRAIVPSTQNNNAANGMQDFNFEEIIPTDYNIHIPPPTNGTPTKVDMSILILNVRDIKELSEEMSLEINIRMYWKDTRLSHLANFTNLNQAPFLVLNSMILDKIWHPDIFIDHVKAVTQPSLISRPASLRIYADSTVRYSARITLAQACQMDFHYYPADTQKCNVDMKSYGYTDRTLNLTWKEGKGASLVTKLYLPNFDVGMDPTMDYVVETTSGRYSAIRFTILLRRKLSYHLLQTYLPSTLFIIVSWLSFLVPPESVPGRMALCMTTLLTLTAMFSAVRQNTPNVSYVKALDIWMVVCIIFVFLTLLEYTILLKLKSKKEKQKKKTRKQNKIAQYANSGQNAANGFSRDMRIAQICHPATFIDFPGLQIRRPKPSLDSTTEDNKDCPSLRNMQSTESVITLPNHGINGSPALSHRNVSAGHQSPPSPLTQQPPTMHISKYELAAKKIEKFTSAIIPTLFIVFNFIYWPWLIESANYYQHFDNTVYYSI